MTVDLPEIVAIAAIHYVLVVILTISEVAKPLRGLFRALAGRLPGPIARKFVRFDRSGATETRDAYRIDSVGYDFISCRLCVGFWVTVFGAIAMNLDPITAAAAYGLSYFATMMEPIEQ